MIESYKKKLPCTFKAIRQYSIKVLNICILTSILTSCQQRPKTNEIPDEHRFKKIVLTEETMEPTALSVSYDGKVFYAEDIGTIKVYNPNSNSVSIVGELAVFSCGDEGLIGMTLDPDFQSNGWLYVNYTVSDVMNLPCGEVYKNPDIRFGDTTSNQVISRFTISDEKLDMTSEKVLLKVPNQHLRHLGGSLAFDGAGNLYISIGENTHPGFTNAYAPVDERPGRKNYDTQRTSVTQWIYGEKYYVFIQRMMVHIPSPMEIYLQKTIRLPYPKYM